MSFDVKHYVAIGLGLVVFAGFAMQKSTAPKRLVGFDNNAGEFRPLSSFELATEPPPNLAVMVQAPRIPVNEMPLAAAPAEVAKIDEVKNAASIGQQVAFDNGSAFTRQESQPVPSYIETKSTTDQTPVLPQAPQANVADQPLELEAPQQEFVSAFVSAEASAPSGPKITRAAGLTESRWSTNPFIGQAVATKNEQPMTEPSDGQVSNTREVLDNSIIVEPQYTAPTNDDLIAMTVADATESSSDIVFAEPAEPIANDNGFQPSSTPANDSLVMKQLPDPNPSKNNAWVAKPTAEPTPPATQPTPVSVPAFVAVTEQVPRELPLPDSTAQQAVHHIEYGKSLSRRGAAFAARQEFYTALRVIAQANDSTANTTQFSRALSDAILAMKEAKDFVTQNSESELLLDVSSITELHRSKIINLEQARTTTASQAMDLYYGFAQDKLDEAGGRNAVSVEALYCLGKLHSAASKVTTAPQKSDVIRAITYHQAALAGDPDNYRSANELGVLKVRMGELEPAVEMFKQSLIARPTPQGWQNLAKTHERLGQTELAQLASAEFTRLAQTSVTSSPESIQWVTNQTFNANLPKSLQGQTRVAELPITPAAQPKTTAEKIKAKSNSISQKLKSLF